MADQLIIPGSCSIRIWADSLKKCLDLIQKDTRVYWGHDEGRTGKEEIEAVRDYFSHGKNLL